MSSLPVVNRTLPRTAWILLTAGAVVLSLFVAILVFNGAVSESGPSQVIEPSLIVSESDDGTDDAAEGVETPIALPLVAYEVFLSRDPFEPVVEPDEPSPVDGNSDPADPDDPNTAPGAPSDPNGTQTDPARPGSDPDGTQTGRCRGDAEVVCDGTLLVLEDLRTVDGEEIAVIVVGDVTYQVRPGERFAESFELLRIDVDSVRLLYGDEVFSLRLLSSVMK